MEVNTEAEGRERGLVWKVWGALALAVALFATSMVMAALR